jgi:predicted cupin superfamily sugar epimerase
MTTTAQQLIDALGLVPHPEGGWYAETFRDTPGTSGRAYSTAIYFLLQAGERSHWHRVDAAEVWLFHLGAPLALELSEDGHTTRLVRLGPDVLSGEHPQAVVPPHAWQQARSLGDFTLVSCTVAPGFDFRYFEIAPFGWEPG